MANYQKNADSALKSIVKAGTKLEIFRPVVAFDDTTGIPTEGPTLRGYITAVVLPRYKGQIFGSLDDSLKEALVRGKLKTVLAAAKGAPFAPGPLDVITINGTQWQVVGCTALAPDGVTAIIYTIGVVEGAFTPTPEDA
jgi:hypothetical protein